MLRVTSIVNGVESFLRHNKAVILKVHPCCSSRVFLRNSLALRSLQTSSISHGDVKEFSQIPGPPNLPVVGSLPTLLMNDFDPSRAYLFWEKMFAQYGPLVKLKLPGLPIFICTRRPEDIETLLKSTMTNPIRPAFYSLKKVRDETPGNYFEKRGGILTENHDEWWRVRSRVQAPLMKPKNVSQYLPAVDEATVKFIDRIDMLQKDTGRVPDNFQEELYKWALECVGLVALDKNLGCLEAGISEDSVPLQLIDNINRVFKALNNTEINFHWWKIYKTKDYVDLENAHYTFLKIADESINESIERMKAARSSNDSRKPLTIIETFLQTEGLSKADVVTMILDMVFAGVDTTSHTVGFALYLLAKNPECQSKLQKEVDEVLGDSNDLLPEHIARMKYLNRVLKESLRIFPLTVAIARESTEEMILSGYKVPAGCTVLGHSIQISRDEAYFKRASEFIPERWDRDRPLGEIHPFASLPFSHGTRMCIGKRIAEQEIYAFIIRIMQKYSVTFESNAEMELKFQLVMKPSIPLAFKFHSRIK